ncbi:MAG: DUF87 domain-containing protein [Fervidicoccaceae archaeon]
MRGKSDVVLQGVVLIVIGFALTGKIGKFLEFLNSLSEGVGDSSVIRYRAAVLALVFTALCVSLFVLYRKRGRVREKEARAWRLEIIDSTESEKALAALYSLIKNKSRHWGSESSLILSLSPRGAALHLCLSDMDPSKVEFIEGFLRSLEPEIRWKRDESFKCPEHSTKYTSSPDALFELFGKQLRHDAWGNSRELPKEEALVYVGRCKRTGSPLGLTAEELLRHVGIFGSTGSGKTTTSAVLATGAASIGMSVVILDWHGEYGVLLEEACAERVEVLDPLEDDSASVNPLEGAIEDAVSMLEDVLSLSAPQSAVLYRVLKESGGSLFGISSLIALLDSKSPEGYWDRELRGALLRKLELLDSPEGKILFSKTVYRPPSNGEIQVINLSNIKNFNLKKLYSLALIKFIYQTRYARGGAGGRILLVVDEAHNIMPKSVDNFVSKMIAESRKFGIGVVIVTQSPSSVNPEFIKNLNTKIVHAIRSNIDMRILEESMALEHNERVLLPRLEIGEAFFSSPSCPKPTLIVIEKSWCARGGSTHVSSSRHVQKRVFARREKGVRA